MISTMNRRKYSELVKIPSFEERFEYLKLSPSIMENSLRKFRYLNQRFYQSMEWRNVRNKIVVRDRGFDLGVEDRPISGRIYVHHMTPVTLRHLEEGSPLLLDPENLISCSIKTHEAITLGDMNLLEKLFVERSPGDTKLW